MVWRRERLRVVGFGSGFKRAGFRSIRGLLILHKGFLSTTRVYSGSAVFCRGSIGG